jgi:hypothetical protein
MPGWHGLAAAAELYEQGRLTVPIHATFPLDRAATAHAAAEQGSRRGWSRPGRPDRPLSQPHPILTRTRC